MAYSVSTINTGIIEYFFLEYFLYDTAEVYKPQMVELGQAN